MEKRKAAPPQKRLFFLKKFEIQFDYYCFQKNLKKDAEIKKCRGNIETFTKLKIRLINFYKIQIGNLECYEK